MCFFLNSNIQQFIGFFSQKERKKERKDRQIHRQMDGWIDEQMLISWSLPFFIVLVRYRRSNRSPAHLISDWLLLYGTKSRPFLACSNPIRHSRKLALRKFVSDWLTPASLTLKIPAPVFWADIKTSTLFFSALSCLKTEVQVKGV